MNLNQIAILLREIGAFTSSAAHLITAMGADARDAATHEHATLLDHFGRVAVALNGQDPSTDEAPTSNPVAGLNIAINSTMGGQANPPPVDDAPRDTIRKPGKPPRG